MRTNCLLNKENTLNKKFINKYSDKAIAILCILMRFKCIGKDKYYTYVYNDNYIYNYLCIKNNNTYNKENIQKTIKLLENDNVIEYIDDRFKDMYIIDINDKYIEDAPYVILDYNVFDKIFHTKANVDKYKSLFVYLNIIKWFHGHDGYSFITNNDLMNDCLIKDKRTLVNIVNFLIGLNILKCKSYAFTIKDLDNNVINMNKKFYAYTDIGIQNAVNGFMDYYKKYEIKNYNQKVRNNKVRETMIIDQKIRKNIISQKEGDELKNKIKENRKNNKRNNILDIIFAEINE